jgi:hypothetical protein
MRWALLLFRFHNSYRKAGYDREPQLIGASASSLRVCGLGYSDYLPFFETLCTNSVKYQAPLDQHKRFRTTFGTRLCNFGIELKSRLEYDKSRYHKQTPTRTNHLKRRFGKLINWYTARRMLGVRKRMISILRF